MATPSFFRRCSRGENFFDVCGGERGSRLIEDEDLRLAGQRLGDFDHLTARQGKFTHGRGGVDVFCAGAGQCLKRQFALGLAVDQPIARRRICRNDVVGHSEIGNERQFLEDADNAMGIGL